MKIVKKKKLVLQSGMVLHACTQQELNIQILKFISASSSLH